MFEHRLMLLADGIVSDVQVHDVPNILTFNTAGFQRYPGITAVHPVQI